MFQPKKTSFFPDSLKTLINPINSLKGLKQLSLIEAQYFAKLDEENLQQLACFINPRYGHERGFLHHLILSNTAFTLLPTETKAQFLTNMRLLIKWQLPLIPDLRRFIEGLKIEYATELLRLIKSIIKVLDIEAKEEEKNKARAWTLLLEPAPHEAQTRHILSDCIGDDHSKPPQKKRNLTKGNCSSLFMPPQATTTHQAPILSQLKSQAKIYLTKH